MNDPSVDNPMLVTAAGEEQHIRIEEAHAADETRYTLDEAAALLRRRECDLHGHDFDIVVSIGVPRMIVCARCRTSWAVAS